MIGAAIGAVGSVAGGIASGKGAKKAARIQAQSAREQRALMEKLYKQNEARFGSEVANGDIAGQRIMDLLGLSGNDINATQMLRSTPGYQFRMDEALRGVNANAYASGQGNSGATLRALQKTSQGLADQMFNTHLAQVSSVADRGSQAKSALAGVSTQYGRDAAAVSQNAADSAANYQLFKAANFNNMLSGLLKAGGQVFGSSYDTGGK